MKARNITRTFEGLRTYIIASLGIALIICDYNAWFKVPPELKDALLFAGLAFLRAGINKPTK